MLAQLLWRGSVAQDHSTPRERGHKSSCVLFVSSGELLNLSAPVRVLARRSGALHRTASSVGHMQRKLRPNSLNTVVRDVVLSDALQK